MKPWELLYDPVNLAIYLLLSIYASGILLYESSQRKELMSKWHIIVRILGGFTPFYQIIVVIIWSLFKPMELWQNYNSKKKTAKISNKDRENHVFGFLNYKGIELKELDEYIESRNLLGKLIDKIE